MSDLPAGWNESTIVNLIGKDGLFSDGDWVESKDQDPNGAIRLLQLADIGDGKFVNKSHRFVNDKKFELLNFTEILEDDVLVARMPDPLGRACLMPKLPQKCITVVDVAIIRPGKDSVLPRWLMHFLNSPEIRQRIELLSSGTTRKRISRGNLAQIELPIPPLDEQKRIAEKLDTLLARVASCQTHLERVPQILKHFRQSVLAAAASGRLTEEWREENKSIKWKSTTIGDLCEDSFYGPRFGKNEYTDSEKGIPTIRTTDMTVDGRIEVTQNTPKILVPPEKLELYRVHKGDLLVTRTGSIGVMAVFEDDYLAIPSAYLIRFRFYASILPRFAFYCLMSPYGKQQLGLSTTAITQPNVNAEAIKRIEIKLPTLEEQVEIVRRVEKLFAYAERLEARYTSASEHVERLTPSLLAKAFRGELVEQDLNNESAEILLEKIRKAKVNGSKESKQPRRRLDMTNTKNKKEGKRISVIQALEDAGEELSTEQLFVAAGFPSDAESDLVEEFFVEVRDALMSKKIKKVRDNNNSDWFSRRK